MRLSARLTLAFTLVGLIAVAGVASLSWLASAREIRGAVDDSLVENSEILRSITESDLGRWLRENPGTEGPVFTRDVNQTGAITLFGDGTPDPAGLFAVPPAAIDDIITNQEVFRTIDANGRTYRTLTVGLGELPIGVDGASRLRGALLYRDVTSEEQAIDDLALRLGLLGIVAVAVVALGGWFMGRRLARPLEDLSEAVDYVASNDTAPHRIEIDRGDEIGRLADRFNSLLSALEVGREQQRRLVTDASHELRTPLTALRLRTEYAASFDNLTPAQVEVVEGAVGDLEQLSALVADLVDLATDASPSNEEPQFTSLVDVVEPVVRRTAVATGRTITVHADGSAAVTYPDMIRRAVQNLLDNAAKYSTEGQPIEVHIVGGAIEVRDHGPGIAAEDIEFVFDRFFRSPKARNRPGNGIGLAIVQHVAETHNGSTFASSEPGQGARIGFSVPGV